MVYWVFGLECSKAIVIFVNNELQFGTLKFGTKNALFGYFGEQF